MTNKTPTDTWVLDCTNYECDGHMELVDVVVDYNDVSAPNGHGQYERQEWVCDKCGEHISDPEREDLGIDAYIIH